MATTKDIQNIIDKYYPEDCGQIIAAAHPGGEWAKRVAAGTYREYMKRPTVSGNILGDPTMDISIKQPALGHILSAKFKTVEKCCAMCFLYDFYVYKLDPNLLKELMDAFLGNATKWTWFSSRRLIVNMVERRSQRTVEDALDVVVPSENPNMAYKPLWDYFHQNARVQTILMPNNNGGNIIHHMEVVFPVNYFN